MQELVKVEESKALEVFTAEKGLDPYLQLVRDEIDSHVPDMETKKGRDAIKSLAAKVSKSKTALDTVGKNLVAELKKQPKVIDAERKRMRDLLDDWRDEVKQPVLDYEAEQIRIAAEELAKREAEKLAAQVESDHEYALLLDEKITKEREEVAAKAEAERVAREEAMKAEAAEKARLEAEAKAKAEADKLEAAKKAAIEAKEQAERAKIAAEERAKAQAEAAEKARVEAEAKAKRDAEEAAERAKAQAEAAQAAKEKAERLEQEAREANKRHVGNVRREAKEALMLIGLYEEQAKKVVLAIDKNEIPAVTINY